jgi:zinc protease
MSARFAIGSDTITRRVLANGIVILVQENHVNPSVVLRGQIQAGSLYEEAEQAGLAQFTASCLTRGTSRRTFQQISEETESVGAGISFGADVHLAGFSGKCLSEDFSLLLDILADVLMDPVFPATEVEKVRGQIITGLREVENNTHALADREFRTLLYGRAHPYGRSADGYLETIPGITRETMINFHQSYYRPNVMIIVVVGDLETTAVIEGLGRALGDWRVEGHPSEFLIPPVSPLSEIRRLDKPIPGKTQTDIAWGVPGLSRADPDYYAAGLANLILGQLGLMGRLGEVVRDRQGLAYYAYSGLEAGLGPGPWTAWAGVNPTNIERAITAILAESVRLRDEPVSEEELADGMDYLTGVLPLRLETNEGVAGAILEMERFNLGFDYIERYPTLIRSVTREQIREVARRYLDLEHYALVTVGPPGD